MINKVTLLGNVGEDPTIRTLSGGNAVAKLSLATSESYKDKTGQKVTNTEWHRLEAWGPLADIIEKYVKKGDRIYIEGKIKYGSYDKDGQKVYTTDIVVRDLKMLGKKAISNDSNAHNKTEQDDLPF